MAWWQIVLGVIVGLLVLVVLVILHELGHAWAARRNGVKVEEFGIGFPPRAKILGKYKGVLITLNWLPLGGFCKMKGDDDFANVKGDELDERKRKSRDKDSFEAASFWAKTKIMFAGVFMNFLVACVIMTILAFIGLPKIMPDQFMISSDNSGQAGIVEIAEVFEKTPADKSGLKNGDEIVALSEVTENDCLKKYLDGDTEILETCEINEKNSEKITESAQVPEFTKKYQGKIISVEVLRDGKTMKYYARLNDDKAAEKSGYLGLQTAQKQSATIKATWSAPLVGVVNTLQFIWITIAGIGGMIADLFVGLWGLITGVAGASEKIGAVGDSVAGPIGILGTIFPAAMASGGVEFLFLVGVISLTLTVMNILPIPGLDGGRWYLIAGFKLFRKELTKEKEETIVGIGMLVLFALIILITISDVMKLW
ncbi:MAG: M50 family metallopeptidase [Candidatus Nomurabacteria bacterium]|jgi:regulator of sigma E protease|nr:M50 family metallopeptidase [Candidatus Nomurabacteria bacterium]